MITLLQLYTGQWEAVCKLGTQLTFMESVRYHGEQGSLELEERKVQGSARILNGVVNANLDLPLQELLRQPPQR